MEDKNKERTKTEVKKPTGKTKLTRDLITTNKKAYKTYVQRLIKYFTLFIIFLALGEISLIKSFKVEDEQVTTYNEKSNIDYKVYLKENNFYDKDYLGKDMVYVASLIDRINVDFDYDFDIDVPVDLDFTYSIIGKLVITNGNDTTGANSSRKNKFFEKEYKLLNEKTVHLNNKKHLDISEPLVINYNKYNKIANSFRSTYGIETKSDLIVYLVINQKNNEKEKDYTVNNNNQMSITIPLSEKSVDINMDYQEINSSKNIISNRRISFSNILYFILAIILITISIIEFTKGVKLTNITKVKKTLYDKEIDKMLREYDRLIVETSNIPSFEDKEIIKIEKFTELLDVRDNLKIPIMYYIVEEHEKSYFYINNGDIIYLHIVESVDLEGKDGK